MRIIADLANNRIIQVEGSSSIGDVSTVNGKYAIDVPVGSVDIGPASYILPVDGGDVSTAIFEELLGAFPTYNFVQFNTLLDVLDVNKLDPNANLDNSGDVLIPSGYSAIYTPRYQTGSATGQAPNSTALLSANTATTPPKPGLLITDTIDLTPDLGGELVNSLLLYVRAYKVVTSHDIASDYNPGVSVTGGRNEPALRRMEVIDPNNTSDLVIGVSVNDGGIYAPAKNLQPFTPCVGGDKVRIAFANTGSDKIYIGAYAVLY